MKGNTILDDSLKKPIAPGRPQSPTTTNKQNDMYIHAYTHIRMCHVYIYMACVCICTLTPMLYIFVCAGRLQEVMTSSS